MSASFASVLPSNPFFDPQWRKHTEASHAILASATIMSSIFSGYTHLFRPESIHNIADDEKYSLSDMNISPEIANDTTTRVQMYEFISKWLEVKLKSMQINIETNRSIHSSTQPLPPLISSLKKLPDLGLYDGGNHPRLLLQIEVDSGDMNRTIRKLGLGLIDQLRFERNLDDTITTCVGYYFPNNSSYTSVIKVSLTWSDETLDFRSSNDIVSKRRIISDIRRAVQLEKGKNITMPETTDKLFLLPLSKSFVEQKFGQGSVQCYSGLSIVIINSNTKKVYKKSFEMLAGERLLSLLYADPIDQCVLPTARTRDGFYVFDLVHSPLTHGEAKTCLILFAISVKDAITSIHHRKIAHLDIRLENICYDVNLSKALLIDFDRSVEEALFLSNPAYLEETYGKSIMYRVPTTFDIDADHSNLDWRQFGIMLCYILEPNEDYHHTEPKPQNRFLKELVQRGVYDPDLHDEWQKEQEQAE